MDENPPAFDELSWPDDDANPPESDGWTDEPGVLKLFDPEAEAAPLAGARADLAAGRGGPHEKVAEWLKTWGTADEKPMPRGWLG